MDQSQQQTTPQMPEHLAQRLEQDQHKFEKQLVSLSFSLVAHCIAQEVNQRPLF